MAERGLAAPVAALVANAFVWGVSWWPFRVLLEQGLHPLWSTALVYPASCAVVLALYPGAWREFGRQPLLWMLAMASGMTNIGFNWAVTIGDVVRVVLLFYLMPAWSVLLAWLLLDERPDAGALARLVLALAGVAVVLDAGASGVPWPHTLPDLLALLGGFSFALTSVLLRKLGDEPAPGRVLAMFGGGTVLAAAVASAGVLHGSIAPMPPLSVGWIVPALLLAAGLLLGNLGLQYGAARLPAHTTALVMLSEVVFASLSSVALGAAELTPRTLIGGGLIVLAAAWSAWPRKAGSATATC
jgi:drug/metabolite transporter (DMT)-like permease